MDGLMTQFSITKCKSLIFHSKFIQYRRYNKFSTVVTRGFVQPERPRTCFRHFAFGPERPGSGSGISFLGRNAFRSGFKKNG